MVTNDCSGLVEVESEERVVVGAVGPTGAGARGHS